MNSLILSKPLLALLFILPVSLSGQELKPEGKPIAKIFTDYRQQLNGTDGFHGFNVSKAYIGYKYQADSRLSAQILLDVGLPLATQSVTSKRYTYLKNAYISYSADNITLTAGLIQLRGGSVQNKFWGKRYISKPFLYLYKFANLADLGIVADYRINDRISIDATIMNGEGYTNIQMDETLQFGSGITLNPINNMVLRLYGDTYNQRSFSRNTLALFFGYRLNRIAASLEYNYQSDSDQINLHNRFGYSGYLAYNITPRIELFTRYDLSRSVIPEGETDRWNHANDGSLFIGGLQYSYSENLRFALDYQGWRPDMLTVERVDFLQIDCEFRF